MPCLWLVGAPQGLTPTELSGEVMILQAVASHATDHRDTGLVANAVARSSAAPLSHISHRAHWEHGISRGASLAASGLGVLRARGADLLVKGLGRCILPWQAPHGQRLTSR